MLSFQETAERTWKHGKVTALTLATPSINVKMSEKNVTISMIYIHILICLYAASAVQVTVQCSYMTL